MTIDCVIPSLNRRTKLDACLNSLFKADGLDAITVHLYLSDEAEYQHYWAYFDALKDKVVVHFLPKDQYSVPTLWNGHLRTMTADALQCCVDDSEFHKDTFISVIQEYQAHFPDLDGILGICQSNALEGQGMEGAFPVIGRVFADRFPNREVWCKDYFRLHADQELMNYAISVNKFFFSPKCKIVHWHPAFGGVLDTTHVAVREYRNRDKKTYMIRQARGLLWGRDFTLINKEQNEKN